MQVDAEAIKERIRVEEWTPEPLKILTDGEFIALGEKNFQFNQIVTDQMFVKEFSKGDKVSQLDLNWFSSQNTVVEGGEYQFPIWAIIVLVCAFLGFLSFGFGIYKLWANYYEKLQNEELEVLEECAKYEKENEGQPLP